MMNSLSLNTRTGRLTVGQYFLDFSSESAALRTALAAGLQAGLHNQSWGAQVTAGVRFMDEEFTLECDFCRSGPAEPRVVMYWKSGRVAKKGWDATESDLIADRDDLTLLFQAYSGVNGEYLSDTLNFFTFPWERVLTGCSLQAMVVSLSIDGWLTQGQLGNASTPSVML
jgi:hypothetical protein